MGSFLLRTVELTNLLLLIKINYTFDINQNLLFLDISSSQWQPFHYSLSHLLIYVKNEFPKCILDLKNPSFS